MPLKVLFVNSSYAPNFASGAERVVRTLAELLVAAGNQATVLTAQPDGVAVTRQINGVKVLYTPIQNIYRPFTNAQLSADPVRKGIWHLRDSYNFAMSRVIREIIARESPDLINTHNLMGFSAAAFHAIKESRLPVVHTIHDQYLLCPKSTMFRRGRNCVRRCAACWLYAFPRKRMSSHVDAVIGVSKFILQRHIDFGYFKHAKRHVVYNGMVQSGSVEQRDRVGHHPIRLGFLGQIRPTKGLEQLVDAFLRLPQFEAELWIGGRGDQSYEARLRSKTANTPEVTWRGFVDPGEFLREIDILVVPSVWRDTAPLVLIEALREGTPILASNRGGIPEFITNETGWLYAPEDKGSLERALRQCLESRHRLSAMSRAGQMAARQYDEQSFMEAYLRVFLELKKKEVGILEY